MKANENTIINIAEAEGNKPEHAVHDMGGCSETTISDDEKIDVVAARVLKKYRKAFLELAK